MSAVMKATSSPGVNVFRSMGAAIRILSVNGEGKAAEGLRKTGAAITELVRADRECALSRARWMTDPRNHGAFLANREAIRRRAAALVRVVEGSK